MHVNYDDLPRVLEVKDIKRFLKIGIRQAYRLAHSGEFRTLVINGRLKIPKSSFLAWFEGNGLKNLHDKRQ
jgi:hypothetical protein